MHLATLQAGGMGAFVTHGWDRLWVQRLLQPRPASALHWHAFRSGNRSRLTNN